VRVSPTPLPGVLVLEPRVFRDGRGFLYESFNVEAFAAHVAEGLPTVFKQENHSRSTARVLRGLHYQLRRPQGKLVTCVRGEIYDVVVDIRVGSPTFGQWSGITLDEHAPRFVWIPPGFAHGFCVLSPVADVLYKCTDLYLPGDDRGISWCDPAIGIRWPVTDPTLSARDQSHPGLDEARADLPTYEP
jgi:dTDP-4-dehydrorhamnose 3,5-epimerase